MSAACLPPRLALAATLERERLELRERRLTLVVRELRGRAASKRAETGRVPAALGRALAQFEDELRDVRDRLG
jgi:hypothetical protein